MVRTWSGVERQRILDFEWRSHATSELFDDCLWKPQFATVHDEVGDVLLDARIDAAPYVIPWPGDGDHGWLDISL